MQAALPFIDQLVAGSTANEFAQLLDLMGAAAGHRHRIRIRAAQAPAIDRAWTLDVEHCGSRLNPW
jgi:hypothetical protein